MINLTAILSAHTCGEGCWYAKEDVCRCSCNGKNHGILTLVNGQKPERFCIHNSVQYKLSAIGGWGEINSKRYEIDEQAWQSGLRDSERCPAAYIQNANRSQLKWIEVSNFPMQDDETPVLLWVKVRQ